MVLSVRGFHLSNECRARHQVTHFDDHQVITVCCCCGALLAKKVKEHANFALCTWGVEKVSVTNHYKVWLKYFRFREAAHFERQRSVSQTYFCS